MERHEGIVDRSAAAEHIDDLAIPRLLGANVYAKQAGQLRLVIRSDQLTVREDHGIQLDPQFGRAGDERLLLIDELTEELVVVPGRDLPNRE